MAHYDCRHCGASMWDYPDCCINAKTDWIARHARDKARSQATEELREKHKNEIDARTLEILNKQ